MQIKSKEIQIVDIDSIIENPKNPNSHSEEQIERLSKLIKNSGFRNLSDYFNNFKEND